jgi:broad specificity polyphosphatase/5'/3'-nucleotidase SurE
LNLNCFQDFLGRAQAAKFVFAEISSLVANAKRDDLGIVINFPDLPENGDWEKYNNES